MSARAESEGRPPRRLDVWVVALVTLAARGWLVLALADVFFYGEELEKGAAAKALLDRLPVPVSALAYHEYEIGGFLVSGLKALAFLLVGENLLAHKLLALAFAVAIALAARSLAAQLFGRAAALAAGLLVALGPPVFQQLSLLSLGIHYEATLWLLLLFGATARVWDGEARPRAFFGLGLAAGFGVAFSYQLVPFAAAGLVALAVHAPARRALVGLRGAVATAGALVGLAPLLAMAAAVGPAVLDVHGTRLIGSAGPPASHAFREFLRSIFFEGALGPGPQAALWPLAVAGAAFASLFARRLPRRKPALALTGLLALWLVVYLASPFVVGAVDHPFLLMRWAPAAVIGTLLVSALLGAGLAAGGLHRVLAGAALALLLGHGASGTLRLAAAGCELPLGERVALLATTSGVEYRQYLEKVLPDFPGDGARKLRAVLAFDEPHRERLLADAASALFPHPGRHSLPLALERARGLLAAELGDQAPLAELGLGALLVAGSGWDPARALRSIAHLGPVEGRRLAEAIGRFGSGRHPTLENLHAELAAGLALRGEIGEERLDAYARGLGRRLYLGTRLRPERAEAWLTGVEPALAHQLRAGRRRARELRRVGGGR